jgi:hypothetical protein
VQCHGKAMEVEKIESGQGKGNGGGQTAGSG